MWTAPGGTTVTVSRHVCALRPACGAGLRLWILYDRHLASVYAYAIALIRVRRG
jgi:hypothetical protein